MIGLGILVSSVAAAVLLLLGPASAHGATGGRTQGGASTAGRSGHSSTAYSTAVQVQEMERAASMAGER